MTKIIVVNIDTDEMICSYNTSSIAAIPSLGEVLLLPDENYNLQEWIVLDLVKDLSAVLLLEKESGITITVFVAPAAMIEEDDWLE